MMGVQAVIARWPAPDRRMVMWLAALAALGLLPALVNGFPLYHADSEAYSGAHQLGGIRSIIPGALAKPLVPVFGPWALPVVNAAMFAVIVTRFAAMFLPRIRLTLVLAAVLATATPMLISAVIPDMWIVCAYLGLFMLVRRFSWIDFAICVIAVSGHGLNPYLFLSSMVLAGLFLGPQRWQAIKLIAAITAGAVVLEAAVNLAARGNPFPEQLGTGVIASKVINDVPEAFDQFCARAPGEKLCRLRDKIDAQRAEGLDYDAQYLWRAGLMPWDGPPEETLSLSELAAVGRRLGLSALRTHPVEYLKETARDMVAMFRDTSCFVAGDGYVERTAENARWMSYLNDNDHDTLARQGYFGRNAVCSILAGIKIAVFALASLVGACVLVRHAGELRGQVMILLGAVVANDIGFALTSAPSGRYHDRLLFLAAVVVLLAFNHWKEQQSDAARAVNAA